MYKCISLIKSRSLFFMFDVYKCCLLPLTQINYTLPYTILTHAIYPFFTCLLTVTTRTIRNRTITICIKIKYITSIYLSLCLSLPLSLSDYFTGYPAHTYYCTLLLWWLPVVHFYLTNFSTSVVLVTLFLIYFEMYISISLRILPLIVMI